MESPAFIDDEVIADSEEDMEQDIYPGPGDQYHPRLDTFHLSGATSAGPGSSNPYRASSVSEFPSHIQPAKAISSISAFTAGPSAIPDLPARFTSPSGKGKEKAADTSITDFVPMPGTIADRAKTRQRTQKPSPRFTSDVIELTSDEDDDDELSLKPSKLQSRPKPKPKPKPKAKEPTKPKQIQNTPNPTSVSDPPPRPRPRPRPKRPKITEEPAPVFTPGAGPFPPTSTPPIPSHGPEIPIATSPPIPMPHQNSHTRLTSDHPMNFELPPSDPPMPSFTTVHTENPVPRIETLPADRPSSPSSLFSERSTASKSNKRKRAQPDMDAEIDELATSQGVPDNVGVGRAHISPRMMGPPPTFFAGSSSASSIAEGVTTTPSNHIPTAVHIPPGDVVDLTMLPPTLAPLKVKKPRKSSKAEARLDEEAAVPRAVVLDEDDQDGDFDPTGDSATKKKGKSKAKEKVAKPTKSKGKPKESATAGISPKAQVEVVITTTKGKGRAKAPAKNKGKQKDATAADKEVFKSREFIEDSDDELQLVGSAAATAADDSIPLPVLPNAIDNEARSNSAVATRPTVAEGLATPSSFAPPSKGSHIQAEMKGDNPPSSRRGTKKRKLIVESDAEEGAAEEGSVVHVNVSPSATKKKRKTGDGDKNDKSKKSKDKKGSKRVLLSDEEEEDAYKAVDDDEGGPNKEKGTKKTPRKASRKIIDDGEEGEPADEEILEESRDSTKENTMPAPNPIAMTPKLHSVSKPAFTPTPSVSGTRGTDTKPPLYTRYEIAPRRSSLPMSELIRRANSIPGSPFSTPHPSTPAPGSSKLKPLTARSGTAYSPYLKSSRSMLSRIAPLHPNRRTPPPPPPPPPPRKKSKKELEMEERWEEEMVESVGGVEAWAVLGDDERREMRRAKWARELGGWDE